MREDEFDLFTQAFAWQCRQWSSIFTDDPVANTLAEKLGREISLAVQRGDSCLLLSSLPFKVSLEELRQCKIVADDLTTAPANFPLFFDGQQRLYLNRCYAQEMRIANKIALLCNIHTAHNNNISNPNITTDGQLLAVNICLRHNFCLISGGPGTGKTWVTGQIIQALYANNPNIAVALCAPTGKAAQRMQESLQAHFISQANNFQIKLANACTVHRLLGINYDVNKPHFNKNNLLSFDVVIVDEASMLDLELADLLFAAIDGKSKLILLGDKNQLDAVEHGLVFSALLDLPQLANFRVELSKNFRFAENSAIAQLAHAVNSANTKLALSCFTSNSELSWINYRAIGANFTNDRWFIDIIQQYDKFHTALRNLPIFSLSQLSTYTAHFLNLFELLNDFRLLTVLRHGKLGVNNLNLRIALAHNPQHSNLIRQGKAFPGSPILIQENQNQQNLANGDIGICLSDDSGVLWSIFPSNQQTDNKFFAIASTLLPRYEYGYALTVHKAQGSEFEHVAIVLPEVDSELVNRQMVYTAITRARSKITFIADKNIFSLALMKSSQRVHGIDQCFNRLDSKNIS